MPPSCQVHQTAAGRRKENRTNRVLTAAPSWGGGCGQESGAGERAGAGRGLGTGQGLEAGIGTQTLL